MLQKQSSISKQWTLSSIREKLFNWSNGFWISWDKNHLGRTWYLEKERNEVEGSRKTKRGHIKEESRKRDLT